MWMARCRSCVLWSGRGNDVESVSAIAWLNERVDLVACSTCLVELLGCSSGSWRLREAGAGQHAEAFMRALQTVPWLSL
jgi:hypothetical protein